MRGVVQNGTSLSDNQWMDAKWSGGLLPQLGAEGDDESDGLNWLGLELGSWGMDRSKLKRIHLALI